jgi:hypothetical protein
MYDLHVQIERFGQISPASPLYVVDLPCAIAACSKAEA